MTQPVIKAVCCMPECNQGCDLCEGCWELADLHPCGFGGFWNVSVCCNLCGNSIDLPVVQQRQQQN